MTDVYPSLYTTIQKFKVIKIFS